MGMTEYSEMENERILELGKLMYNLCKIGGGI